MAEPQIVIENREELHFLLSETLDEGDILEVTGLPPASPLENRKGTSSGTFGPVRKGVKISPREYR